MRPSWLVALALLVASGGCRFVDRFEPAHAWKLDTDLCGWHVLVDHEAGLWKESGCENGRPLAHRVRRLRPAELARLDAAMARLPRDRNTLNQAEYAEVLAVFASLTRMLPQPCQLEVFVSSRDADGTLREWAVEPCAPPHPR